MTPPELGYRCAQGRRLDLVDNCLWYLGDIGALANVRFAPILLKKSKVASVLIFDATLKREAIDDSDSSSRATEVAYEFCVRQ
jgi:hypothetical protein